MMIALFKDCTTNKIVFGLFEVVGCDFCDWNRLATYLGTIQRGGAVYNMYNYCGQFYACVTR
jgi:hypothetical protein